MAPERCPRCAREAPAEAVTCAACGGPLNGAMPPDATAAPPSGKLPPDLKEWARRQFSEEEFLAGLRELRETGGLELKNFLHELEQEANPGE